jgi:hypothetical protein
MKKIFLLVLSILILTSCSSTPTVKSSSTAINSTSSTEQGKSTAAAQSSTATNNEENSVKNIPIRDLPSTMLNLGTSLGIVWHPEAFDFSNLPGHGNLDSVPIYNPDSNEMWQVDLRSCDISALDLRDRLNDLLYAEFDSKTNWTEKLPTSYDPKKIMESGKNPGLNVRELHKKGVTGKGIGIAIIDQRLLVDHIEYKDNLKLYEEIHCTDGNAQMHGPAVASIAVGKNVGVAPGADLYYIAETHVVNSSSGSEIDFTYTAKSIDRILEINNTLPKDKKIRVISISVGWSENNKGYNEVVEAVNKAKEQGIFVVSSSLSETYDNKISFQALGRNPLSNPDDFNSYLPGIFWAKNFYSGGNIFPDYGSLLVPMDSRCTASPTGENDYVFYPTGGWSWSIPYIAGLYALACEVKPDITPEVFWDTAMKTGETTDIKNAGKTFKLGTIADPVKLIESLQSIK